MRQLCKPGFYYPGPSNLMRRSPAPVVSLKKVVKVDRSWRPTVRTGGRIKKDHRIRGRSLGKDLDLSISNSFGCNAAKHQHQFSQGAKTEAERLILPMNSGRTVSVVLGGGKGGQHTLRALDCNSETRPKPTKISASIVSDPHRVRI